MWYRVFFYLTCFVLLLLCRFSTVYLLTKPQSIEVTGDLQLVYFYGLSLLVSRVVFCIVYGVVFYLLQLLFYFSSLLATWNLSLLRECLWLYLFSWREEGSLEICFFMFFLSRGDTAVFLNYWDPLALRFMYLAKGFSTHVPHECKSHPDNGHLHCIIILFTRDIVQSSLLRTLTVFFAHLIFLLVLWVEKL